MCSRHTEPIRDGTVENIAPTFRSSMCFIDHAMLKTASHQRQNSQTTYPARDLSEEKISLRMLLNENGSVHQGQRQGENVVE